VALASPATKLLVAVVVACPSIPNPTPSGSTEADAEAEEVHNSGTVQSPVLTLLEPAMRGGCSRPKLVSVQEVVAAPAIDVPNSMFPHAITGKDQAIIINHVRFIASYSAL
jgi:hypothetical protein